jgi:hypothetical protein
MTTTGYAIGRVIQEIENMGKLDKAATAAPTPKARSMAFEDIAKPLDRPPQLYPQLYSHFVHQLGAMRFNCALADAEDVGDLFIDPAAYYEPTDFSLAQRQRPVASTPLPLLLPPLLLGGGRRSARCN